jgi:hypothetical protein
MNCRHFQNEIFEYVEGTLSADALAAAEKHLTECVVCRKAVEKEKRVASVLSSRLRQTGRALTLRPEIRRNILAVSRQKGLAAAPTMAESVIGLCKYWVRSAAIPVSVLLIAGVLLAVKFSGTRSREIIPVPVTPRLAVTAPGGNGLQTSVSLEMSYRTRQFHQEGNLVVDTLVNETVVANGALLLGQSRDHEGAEPGKDSFSPALEMKTPL